MKLEYCPKCAGIDIIKDSNMRMKKCLKCGYIGKMSEGAMDEINSYKKKLNKSMSSYDTFVNERVDMPNPEKSQNQLKERLKALKGKSNQNSEFL